MRIIVGLGNPGTHYEQTLHNAGFLVCDALSEILKKDERAEYIGATHHTLYTGEEFWFSFLSGERERLILLKPQTFMNESGKAVRHVVRHAGKDFIVTTNLLVIHDDGDIALGVVRIHAGKRSAGHRGVASIIAELGTKEFVRFRVGIRSHGDRRPTEEFVLKKPHPTERAIFENAIQKCAQEIIKKMTDADPSTSARRMRKLTRP